VKTAGFWRKDWFLGLAVAVVLFLFAGSDLIQSLERKAYDLGVRATDRTPSDRIAVIAIDDASIQNIGRWPWPRDVHAKVTDLLARGKAKAVGNLVFFTEPELDPGLAYVNKLVAEYRKAVPDPSAVEQGSPLATIGQLLAEADSALNTDRKLAASYEKAGNVLLPMLFELGDPRGKPDPVDDTVLDNLYNLALDFERKRQFNKAESVFRYMAGHNPKFRDLGERLSRAKQLSETVIFGGGGPKGHTRILTGGQVEKPMLGRYQVERELGKGAMGVVYQGKDPKIGRVVAIKTMALAQEFEADELADVKARFFREAETAGRLNHPNIVTIFDAGEEHDLAYIAMEFLKGRDLVPYTKPRALLPVEKVVSITARVAGALGYAHRQNVVHRDVKAANVMYEPGSDTVKVTDFGIARITESSKTKTGMVLGTPSYMSPEQLAGKRIDGRSDLFSLSVSLYQLLCGRLPFDGESMAQLMFKIANEPAPDILQFNPKLPPALVAFLDRAMAKETEARFQTGDEFAQALRASVATQKPQVDITI
jgi:hypothetical protein